MKVQRPQLNISSTLVPANGASNKPDDIFEPPDTVTITRTFKRPVLNSTRMGSIPDDRYEYSWWGHGYPYTRSHSYSCHGGCENGPISVYREVPEYTADGKPRMRTVTETLSETSYNSKNRSLGQAALGAAAAAGAAALVQGANGNPITAVALGLGAVVGAGIGFATGYFSARGDKVDEVWVTEAISHPRMTGYTESIVPDVYYEEECYRDSNGDEVCHSEQRVRGYWHRYEPDIRWRQVGSFERPTLQHTNAIGPIGSGAITALAAGAVGALAGALL